MLQSAPQASTPAPPPLEPNWNACARNHRDYYFDAGTTLTCLHWHAPAQGKQPGENSTTANMLSAMAKFSLSCLYCQMLDSNQACRGVIASAVQAAMNAACNDSLAGLGVGSSFMALLLGCGFGMCSLAEFVSVVE